MDESRIAAVMAEARACAQAMLVNAAYIRRELPNVQMNDELRAQTEQVCDSLIGTKHDIMTELFELDELLDSGAAASVIGSRVERIVRWFQDDITRLDHLVKALEAFSKLVPAYEIGYVLVAESAANMLGAFSRTAAAAESLLAQDKE